MIAGLLRKKRNCSVPIGFCWFFTFLRIHLFCRFEIRVKVLAIGGDYLVTSLAGDVTDVGVYYDSFLKIFRDFQEYLGKVRDF